MANSTKAETFAVLDRAFTATGFCPTIKDGREHGYIGNNRYYYHVQQQWLDTKARAGVTVNRRMRGRTVDAIATTAREATASVPVDLWQLAAAEKIKSFPANDSQPEELSPSEKCVRLYWSAWGGITAKKHQEQEA